MTQLKLTDEKSEVTIDQDLGAGVTCYRCNLAGPSVDILRPCLDLANKDPFAQGCNVLVPWSNRIGNGGFSHAGRFVKLEPNIFSEPMPLHGNGLIEKWQVEGVCARSAKLSLRSVGPGLFDYSATLDYSLRDGALRMALVVTHEGQGSLPYGMGFHPWFVRILQTTLQAKASTAWRMDESQLPAEAIAVADEPEWDFGSARTLPRGFIDNPFAGWDGEAEMTWPERHLGVSISVSDSLARCYHVYAPAKDAGFFCFEPVSHLPDEHNQAATYGSHAGLVILERGASLACHLLIKPFAIS